MDNAYFRCVDGEDQFRMVFKLTNPALGVDRQFNFQRTLSEPLQTFLNRVATNIEKISAKKLKKKKFEEANRVCIDVNLLTDNDTVIDNNLSCKEVFFTYKNLSLKIQDSVIPIKVNTPWIEKVTLPTSILCGFPVYPNKFEGYFLKKERSIFTWIKKLGKESWQKIGEGFYYIPTSHDIGCSLKLICTPGNDITTGPEVEIESEGVVEAGPGFCPFESRHCFTTERLTENNFRVVSYNILADLYCDSDYSRDQLYPYCPPYALAMDYRIQLILKELIGYNGDIICMQEVDEKIFNYSLSPVLSEKNYMGIFNKKGGTVREGLTCFFNLNRFKCLSTETIVFGEELNKNSIFSNLWDKVKSNKPFCERILARTTSLQTVVLESIDNTNEILVIGNTHLYFHPDADHVRLFQSGLITTYLNYVVNDLIKQFGDKKRISLLLCGDFNSVPECGIYQLMTTGNVSETSVDWTSNADEAVTNVSLSQPFQLASACGTPKYTNFTAGFADCLDYIFYQKNHMSVSQVVPFPSDSELTAHTALPSIVFPSDHIALIADLKWIR